MTMAMRAIRLLAPAAAALSVLFAMAQPAEAACFESGVGCTDSHYVPYWALRQLSCENLWWVRNTIYDENGYCFTTIRGQQAFDNSDCYANNGTVQLNRYERENVGRIVRVEREKACN
jgi:hypothetical protein